MKTLCKSCGGRFKPARADALYCSNACRQRAHRDRGRLDELERELEATRVRYWRIAAQLARARGVEVGTVLTGEAQSVDEHGNVFMHGIHVGRIDPDKPGWAKWGLEAAGPPFTPPP